MDIRQDLYHMCGGSGSRSQKNGNLVMDFYCIRNSLYIQFFKRDYIKMMLTL